MVSKLIWMIAAFVTGWLLRSRPRMGAPELAVDVGETVPPSDTDEMAESNAEVGDGLLAELSHLRETVAALQASVSALDKQWGRVGREQFKANTLVETQQQQAQAALEQLRELSVRREAELAILREQLRADHAAQRLSVIERILPALDGLDEALAAGARLLERAPQLSPAPSPLPWPVLNVRQRLAIALGRADLAQLIPPPVYGTDVNRLNEWRAAVAAWLRGLTFVRERLLETLAAEGVRPIAAEGEPFDPHRHLAIESVPASDGAAAGTVVAEYRRGYARGDHILRPAEVVVARASDDVERLS